MDAPKVDHVLVHVKTLVETVRGVKNVNGHYEVEPDFLASIDEVGLNELNNFIKTCGCPVMFQGRILEPMSDVASLFVANPGDVLVQKETQLVRMQRGGVCMCECAGTLIVKFFREQVDPSQLLMAGLRLTEHQGNVVVWNGVDDPDRDRTSIIRTIVEIIDRG
jgi:hypothetical protein